MLQTEGRVEMYLEKQRNQHKNQKRIFWKGCQVYYVYMVPMEEAQPQNLNSILGAHMVQGEPTPHETKGLFGVAHEQLKIFLVSHITSVGLSALV